MQSGHHIAQGKLINNYMSDNLQKNIEGLGDAINKIITDALKVEDIRAERTASIDFVSDEQQGIIGKGLYWKGHEYTRQFVFRGNGDRLWSSETIDLQNDKTYNIGNVPVLSANELGSTITRSNLVKVGTLQNLRTQGDLRVDDFITYTSANNRIGIGTEDPNGTVSIVSLDSEFVIDVETTSTRIGNWTTDDLEIITDDTTRITVEATGNIKLGSDADSKITIPGKLGIGVKNFATDADITTAGPVRFQGKKQETGSESPKSGVYSKGDIVWNTDPKPTGYVGWICVREGTPGIWRSFGQISNS